MKSGLFTSSEISTPVVLNAQSCVVAAVSPTRAISTSTAYQILSLMICYETYGTYKTYGIEGSPCLLVSLSPCLLVSLSPCLLIFPQSPTHPACAGRCANAPERERRDSAGRGVRADFLCRASL